MRLPVLALLLVATLTGSTHQPPWTLTLRSVGPVRIGSTIAEFRRAMGRELAPGQINRDCGYAHTRDEAVYFYTRNGRVALASVRDGSSVRTPSGIRVGSTERDLRQAYAGRLVSGGSPEGSGEYLVYVPQDVDDQNYRLVFLVDEGRVLSMDVGTMPDILSTGEASRCFEG